METKIDVEHEKNLAKKWAYKFYEGSGGVLMLWDENVNVVIKFMNKNSLMLLSLNTITIISRLLVYIGILKCT